MLRSSAPSAALVPLALLLCNSGCLLSELNLDGKECPCVTGFICDQAKNVCVPENMPPDAGALDVGPAIDTGVPVDLGVTPDMGPDFDAGPQPDLGPGVDTGVDAGVPTDAGMPDTGLVMCQRDVDCDPPQRVCRAGLCEPGCAEPAGPTCSGVVCHPSGHCFSANVSCTVNTDCTANAPDSVCINGLCEQRCTVQGADCTGNQICNVSTGYCEGAPACAQASDCADPNFICPATACVRRCDAPGGEPCLGGSNCDTNSGLCTGLALGANCTMNQNCSSGLCRASPGGALVCAKPCGATADCPNGMVCQYELGAKSCFSGQSFPQPQVASTLSGESCMNPANTCQSLICEANTCVEQCAADRHCAGFGSGCAVHQQPVGMGSIFTRRCFSAPGVVPAGGVCNDHLECSTGLCDRFGDVCRELCCTDTDCAPDQNCLIYDVLAQLPFAVCQPAGLGMAQLGTVCTADTECESGVCAPVDPGNLNGTRKCTVNCCTHADCASLGGAWCHPLPSQIVAGNFTNTCVGL